ncbi:hypothetical protein C9J12_08820 [Photobacterium frigidiphilum]|uniref:Uncharacterized protein n=1 Tax=Photobacterium frigidiphilum TaxID=264736 RepID=A0A2T3JJK6_9GAMM|nr:LssY C-terminal domain-containing protein [Photobacterium frigidiphilum]PSU49090.1 hypothetical protein C9J12_08820 [Photobacterium frigidiphilum]
MKFSWWWFFGGNFLDALIGPNLFFPGEPFLLAAGYALHNGFISGIIFVFIGGFLGDQISYCIGRKQGYNGRRWLTRRIPKTRRPFAKAKLALNKRGPLVVAVARLLGPVAWIMPFLAGSYAMSWTVFTLYSLIGLLLGVGQFVILGYMLAAGIHLLPDLTPIILFFSEHSLLIISVIIASVCSAFFYRKKHKSRWFGIAACWVVVLCGMNYVHFFISDAYAYESPTLKNNEYSVTFDSLTLNKTTNLQTITDLSTLEYKTYPGLAPVYQAQPINIVLVGSKPNTLMKELGWIENKTFSRDNVSMKKYLSLMAQDLPPISDLYWNQQPQWSAYQQTGNLLQRNHIRWWYAGSLTTTGEQVWLGAISYDNHLKVAHYKGIITVLHAIDPDVDVERDSLAQHAQNKGWQVSFERFASPAAFSKSSHYFSDGQVAVITLM